jgi:hypothetical protein
LAYYTVSSRKRDPSLDSVWLDFRNSYGIVWSLRVMEQVNAVAKSSGWNVVLCWSGYRTRDGAANWELPSEQLRVLRQSLQNLLRRFMSSEWIAERLGDVPERSHHAPP